MIFLNTNTNEYPVALAQMQAAYPLTIFPAPLEGNFEEFEHVKPTQPPEHDPATHRAVEVDPIELDGEWQQAWEVVVLTVQEIEAARRASVPTSVTMRQARLALLGAGLLAGVDAARDGLPSPQKEAARIEWEYATEVQRSSGLVPMMEAALGLDDAALDALFIEAAAL